MTSDEYAAAVERQKEAKESAAREKERVHEEKEAAKRRKALEKEARALEATAALERRNAEKELVLRMRTERAAQVAAARAMKAAEKARVAGERVGPRCCGGRATATPEGQQGGSSEQAHLGGGAGEEIGEASEPWRSDFSFAPGGIPNHFASFTPPSPQMHQQYFMNARLLHNQFGGPMVSTMPTHPSQPILQPTPVQNFQPTFRVPQ